MTSDELRRIMITATFDNGTTITIDAKKVFNFVSKKLKAYARTHPDYYFSPDDKEYILGNINDNMYDYLEELYNCDIPESDYNDNVLDSIYNELKNEI